MCACVCVWREEVGDGGGGRKRGERVREECSVNW